MSFTFKDKIKPSDFDVQDGFMGDTFGNYELEAAVANIIIISQENGDAWFDFTFADYKKLCTSRTDWEFDWKFDMQKDVLDELWQNARILRKKGRRYSVNENFFRVLAMLIK